MRSNKRLCSFGRPNTVPCGRLKVVQEAVLLGSSLGRRRKLSRARERVLHSRMHGYNHGVLQGLGLPQDDSCQSRTWRWSEDLQGGNFRYCARAWVFEAIHSSRVLFHWRRRKHKPPSLQGGVECQECHGCSHCIPRLAGRSYSFDHPSNRKCRCPSPAYLPSEAGWQHN